MVLKQLSKIAIFLYLTISINGFSQLKMSNVEDKELLINLKTEKRNIIKIFDDSKYSIFYILDRGRFDLKEGIGINETANLIFFSKKYNKGILTIFKQTIEHKKKSTYRISLHTGSTDNYMFIPSMIIVNKNFNYEYLMKYSYINLPNNKNVYTSTLRIQDIKNYCNIVNVDIKSNIIYENIDDIFSNIPKIRTYKTNQDCEPIIPNIDIRDFFPKKVIK